MNDSSTLSSPRAPSAHELVPWGKREFRACPWPEQGGDRTPLALGSRFRGNDGQLPDLGIRFWSGTKTEGRKTREWEGKHVLRAAGWLWIIGFFGWFAAANAQTQPPSTPVTAFDGTYVFVSATKVNETYTTRGTEHILRCGDYKGGPLIIVNGQARYLGRYYQGTIGPRGELAMRNVPEPVKWGGIPGVEKFISGGIDKDGTVRARQISGGCSYDLILRKESK